MNLNDTLLEKYKQRNEKDFDNESLKSFESLEELLTLEDDAKTVDTESVFFEKVKSQIENDLTNLKAIVEDLNKMREKTANLEAGLVTIIDCSTWQNVSEFIGISSTNMVDECMKILDHTDAAECSTLTYMN